MVGDAPPTTLHVAKTCADGLYCGADHTCTLQGAVGDACGAPDECGDGTYCASGVCRVLPDVGQPCGQGEGFFACAGDAWCDGKLMCEAPLGAGARCDEPIGGGPQECAAGLRCVSAVAGCSIYCSSYVCQAAPTVVADGEACDGAMRLCGDSSYCDATTSLCIAKRAGGALCTGSTVCASNDCVDGVCTAAPAVTVTVPSGCSQ
jgi:hypothetical protein